MKRGFQIWIICLLIGVLYACNDDNEIEEPQFVTSDIDLFWEVYDRHNGDLTEEVIREEYTSLGSSGLQDFEELTSLSSSLKTTIRANRSYYEAIRKNTLDLSDPIQNAKRGLVQLREVFPQARIPNVYFLVGAMNSGGKISSNGLLIAAEMFSKDDDTSLSGLSSWHYNVLRNREYIPSIVVHECIHVQQSLFGGSANFTTVIEKSIQEGMADFIARKVMPNAPFFNEHLHAYGDPREVLLWREFEMEKDMVLGSSEWLYTGEFTANGHPADMGYYIGYKIVEAYSETFPTIGAAIEAMLTTSDYNRIFEKSGYGSTF